MVPLFVEEGLLL